MTTRVIACASVSCAAEAGAEAKVTDQALFLHLGQRAELFREGFPPGALADSRRLTTSSVSTPRWRRPADLGPEVRGLEGGLPAAVPGAARADLGDDAQARRVGVQGLPDEFVDHDGP